MRGTLVQCLLYSFLTVYLKTSGFIFTVLSFISYSVQLCILYSNYIFIVRIFRSNQRIICSSDVLKHTMYNEIHNINVCKNIWYIYLNTYVVYTLFHFFFFFIHFLFTSKFQIPNKNKIIWSECQYWKFTIWMIKNYHRILTLILNYILTFQ